MWLQIKKKKWKKKTEKKNTKTKWRKLLAKSKIIQNIETVEYNEVILERKS